MTIAQILFLALTFVVVSGLIYLVASVSLSALESLPEATAGSPEEKSPDAPGITASAALPHDTANTALTRVLRPLAKLSLPSERWDTSPLRTRFLKAGFRSGYALVIYFSCKTLGTFLMPLLFVVYIGIVRPELRGATMLVGVVLIAAFGYYLPNAVLARIIARRKRELFENFPDALDLMRVCVEAGLALDAAIARVGDEMRLKSEALYEELHLLSLELRAGSARDRALRNLAMRMDMEEVDGLVAMLIQAERFGTSITESLRVHADSLRYKRRQKAEEIAAKVPVKLLFPLIFCIFPALLVVLLGPALINIYRILLPTVGGH